MHYNIVHQLLHWVVSGLALAVTAAIVPGIHLRGFATAMVATLLIGFANYLVWPILFFLTLPLTILTFGLFIFVVDAIVLRLCAAFMKNFEITNWFSAVLGAMVLAFTSSVLHWFLI
jgi:putative membrane protein